MVMSREDILDEMIDELEAENAELRAVLRELLTVVEGENPHFGLMGMIDGYYGDFLDEVDPVVERAHAALAEAEEVGCGMDITEQIVKWEEGEMSEQEEVDFFQYLVETGAFDKEGNEVRWATKQ